MGMQEAAGTCNECGDVLVRRATANHILHLILSVVTAGLWIIVWILCAIRIGGWRCTRCGKRSSRKLLA